MRVLILGAGGFIGSHLCEKMSSKHEVVAVDTCLDKIPPETQKSIQLYPWDIRGYRNEIEDLTKASDLIVDLIAYANPSIYVKRPLDVVDLNFFENHRIMEYCIRHHKRLVQFSTCEVYGMSGGSDIPFSEAETPLIMGPVKYQRWIYASGKQFLERIIYAHGAEGDLNYTIIRPFNFIGPRIDYLPIDGITGIPRVFSLFLSSLIDGNPLFLVDGGINRRSFTYIDDAIEAVMIIMENANSRFDRDIVNIGNPANEASIRQIGEMMRKIYIEITGKPCKSDLVEISGTDFYGAGYQDCDRRIPDISKLASCGWNPHISLEETLRKSMEYYLL